MYDIKPLEEQWESYNKRKRRPYYIFTVLFLSLAGIAVLVFNNKELILSKFEKSIANTTTNTGASLTLLDKPIDTLEVKQTKKNNALTMNQVKPEIVTPVDNNPMNPSDVFIEVTEAKKPMVSVRKNVVNEKPRKKIHLEITEMSGEKAYKDVKNRFSMAPDPDDSLFLARNYYQERKYSKAAYWALQTNKLNGDIEESWLIFAKSKSKTGHKNEAIRVLTQYVNKSNSREARKLLIKLRNK